MNIDAEFKIPTTIDTEHMGELSVTISLDGIYLRRDWYTVFLSAQELENIYKCYCALKEDSDKISSIVGN